MINMENTSDNILCHPLNIPEINTSSNREQENVSEFD